MSNLNQSQPSSLPPVHHYDVIYEYLVHDLAILMAHDQREHWTPMLTVDADETINQPKLDYLKEHIAAIEEEYVRLDQTSKELIATGKSWMIDAAKHPSDVRDPQLTRYKQLRDDHVVSTLESNAREKLSALRDEINRQKSVYRAAKGILSQTRGIDTSNSSSNTFHNATGAFETTSAAGSNRRTGAAPINASSASANNAFISDDAPDQPDQFYVVADVNLQDPLSKIGGVRDSTDAALDQEKRAVATPQKWERKERFVKEQKLQSIQSIENYLRNTDAPMSLRDINLHAGSFPTVRRLFEFMYRRLQPSSMLPAFNNQQDFAQYFADVLVMLGYPAPLTKVQVQIMTAPHVWPYILSALEWLVCLQPIVEANSEVTSPSRPAPDSNSVRQSNDTNKKGTSGYTVSDGSGQYSEETNLLWDEVQDSDTDTETVSSFRVDYPTSGQYSDETKSLRDEVQGPDTFTETGSSFRMDYPTKYEASVRELYSMLMELDEDLCESPNIECSETSRLETEQIIRVLKQATDLVSSTGTNWMVHAAETNSYREEWETLPTARKGLNVVSLQRRASATLQQLRRACRKDDHIRDEPLRFNARADTFGDPIDELFFGNGQASKCNLLMDVHKQHDAVQMQYDAPKRKVTRAVFTEHLNPDSDQHTHDDLRLAGSSTNSHRTLQSDATVTHFQHSDSCLRREPVIEHWRAVQPDKTASKGRTASISSTRARASVNAAKGPQLEVADVNNNFTDVSCQQTSKTYSAKLAPVYDDLNELPSYSEEEDNVPDQNGEVSERFDDDCRDAQKKNTGTYAILSNQENGSHRNTQLECVKVTVGHPPDKSPECETVLLLDSASDHTYFKQSLGENLHLPDLGPTKLSVANFLSSDEITVDIFTSQLRIRKSSGKTTCIKAPVMPDQFTRQMRTAFIRPEHIKGLRQGSCAVCPSTETQEILVGRDLRHLFEVVEEHKPLPGGFLLAHTNVGTMLVGAGRADKSADESELSHHRSVFIQGSSTAKSDDVSIDQLLEAALADENIAQNNVSSLHDQLEERMPHKVLLVSEHAADQKLADLLHQMHSQEQMGVEPPGHLDEDDEVHQRIRERIRWVHGRYEVGLPWRTSDGHPTSSEEPDRPTTVVDILTGQARRLQTFCSPWHENILLGSLDKGTRPDKTTSTKRPKGQNSQALIGQYLLWERAQILDLIESSDGVIDTTRDFDSELELDYDEEMATTDQQPAFGHDQRKHFEVNGRIVQPTDGPIPVLDNHLHADEVESRARDLRTTPPGYATWSQDQAFRLTRHDQFPFVEYITVFSLPNTFLSLDKVQHVSASNCYPMGMCLGACVEVHPGNFEDWHQRDDIELYLAFVLYNATLGPYRVIGLGECGLDNTKKAVVRDEQGVVQTVNGRPLQDRDLEAVRQHQYPVLEKQLNIVVKRLRKTDGDYYPVVLHLRNNDDQQTDVHADAIKIMRRLNMPKEYPIHCHFWSGGRTHYENWTSHFPNTLFGFNTSSFSRGLSPDQLDLLRTIPLDQVTFESGAPYHGKRGTSQTIGTPAGVVRAITQFKELGNRPEDLQTIAQASMTNVIRMYRPDLTVIAERPDEDDDRESQTSPSDQTYRIGPNTPTMFELISICDAGCDGPHRQCADVYLVKGSNDEGLILSDRWACAVKNLHVTAGLRNVRVTSFVHLVLCLWGGRLLQDRPQEMVQFLQELLHNPPDQSSDVLSRWYHRITDGSTQKFRDLQTSDVRLALRKRFHACSLARRYLQTSSPPFQYDQYPLITSTGIADVVDLFQSLERLMPEALARTYDQFVRTTVTVGNNNPDQPGPSRQAQRPTSSHGTSSKRETTETFGRGRRRSSAHIAMQTSEQPCSSSSTVVPTNRRLQSQFSHLSVLPVNFRCELLVLRFSR